MSAARRGVIYGVIAYATWGVNPLYWALFDQAGTVEVLAHRIVWSALIVIALLAITRGFRKLRGVSRRAFLLLGLAAAVVAVNWGVFVWASGHGHVVDISLGYFINPLVMVVMGVLVLSERLRPAQWVAVGLAVLAVLVLTIDYGQPPWVALVLSITLTTYGLIKKKVNVGAVEGLAVETAIMFLPALGYIILLEAAGRGAFGHLGIGHDLLLVGAGFAMVPFLLFSAAAARVPLSTLGFLQYLQPFVHLLIGVLIFREDVAPARWVGFVLVWAALAILTTETLTKHRSGPLGRLWRGSAAPAEPQPQEGARASLNGHGAAGTVGTEHAAPGGGAQQPHDARPAGLLSDCFRGRRFAYQLYSERRESITHPDNPHQIDHITFNRLLHESGPVRFAPLPSAGEPDRSVAFATVCTDKFVPGLETLIASLLEIYPGLGSDFWVYHDNGLSEFNRRRLLQLYPRFQFANRSAAPYAAAAQGNSPNHRRIGALGYLSIEALRLSDYERVVLLDADLLVRLDISPLWADPTRPDVRAVPEADTLPLAMTSCETNNVVINSGVISLPRHARGDQRYRDAIDLLPHMQNVQCPVLDVFADQKFWNVYLQRHELTLLPNTYNATKDLLERYMLHNLGDAAVVHYTRAKPWYSFGNDALITAEEKTSARQASEQFPASMALWHATYRSLIGARRRSRFTECMATQLDELRGIAAGRGAALIGDSASLAESEVAILEDRICVAGDWFVNHERFDDIAVEHLVVTPEVFGGWHATSPAFSEGYLEKLTSYRHRPTLWFPFYVRELVEETPLLRGYERRYVLLEEPFRELAEDLGYLKVDMRDFLSDAHTGVLTAGLPLVMHLGCADVLFVGCNADDGHATSDDQDGMQAPALSIAKSGTAEGPVAYCYQLALAAAHAAGMTVNSQESSWKATADEGAAL